MNENNSNENVNNEVENKVEYVPKSKKSRKGDDGIYVQYRKPSFFSTILLVLIGILIGIVIMLLVYVVKTHKDLELYKEDVPVVEQPQEEQQPEVDEPVVEEKELDLSIEGEFVKELNSKVIHSFRIYNVAYAPMTKTQNDITPNDKMLFMLEDMRKEKRYLEMSSSGVISRLERIMDSYGNNITSVDKFSIEDVEKEYKYLYGEHSQIIKEDIDTNLGYIYEYDNQDDCFYGHSYAGGGGSSYLYATDIKACSANSDKTEIYLDVYYVMIDRSDGYIYPYVVDPGSKDVSKIGETKVSYENGAFTYDGQTDSELLNKYKGNGAGEFRHTFKLDSAGNYYWYSCERILEK